MSEDLPIMDPDASTSSGMYDTLFDLLAPGDVLILYSFDLHEGEIVDLFHYDEPPARQAS